MSNKTIQCTECSGVIIIFLASMYDLLNEKASYSSINLYTFYTHKMYTKWHLGWID